MDSSSQECSTTAAKEGLSSICARAAANSKFMFRRKVQGESGRCAPTTFWGPQSRVRSATDSTVNPTTRSQPESPSSKNKDYLAQGIILGIIFRFFYTLFSKGWMEGDS